MRFDGRGIAYARGRPSYPHAAIEFVFAQVRASPIVVDLGAGTGISTELLAANAALVIAVEPNASMARHRPQVSNVRWTEGSAEATGLANAAADLLTAFQSFHWFDPAATFAEARRILRPGGCFATVENERDESDRATAAYGEIVRRFATDETEARRSSARTAFASGPWRAFRTAQFPHHHDLDRDGLHARAFSTSYLPNTGEPATQLRQALDRLFERYATAGAFRFAYTTFVAIGLP